MPESNRGLIGRIGHFHAVAEGLRVAGVLKYLVRSVGNYLRT